VKEWRAGRTYSVSRQSITCFWKLLSTCVAVIPRYEKITSNDHSSCRSDDDGGTAEGSDRQRESGDGEGTGGLTIKVSAALRV
jgi:hypothetical protein